MTGDGRFMIRDAGPYDVIIVNVPEPLNLRWNRYFTSEFFESARKALSAGGILTVRHGSSENFLSSRNAAALKIIEETLGSVFRYVGLVPGQTVFFIASDSPVETVDIPARMVERGLQGSLLVLDELPYRLSDERREYLEGVLAAAPRRINTDKHPVLVSHELILHGWKSGNLAMRSFEALLDLPPWALPSLIIISVILVGILSRGGAPAKAAVFLTGLSSMTVQLSVMLAYQSYSGVLYHTFVILTGLFMAGAALGAHAGRLWRRNCFHILAVCHVLMAVTAVLVPVWLGVRAGAGKGQLAGSAGFAILSLAGGVLAGIYYRTVVETSLPDEAASTPALFYSWDMFGACAGGLIAGTLLLPLSGLAWTAATVALIHCVAALLIAPKVS
jgi:spermidine synthase